MAIQRKHLSQEQSFALWKSLERDRVEILEQKPSKESLAVKYTEEFKPQFGDDFEVKVSHISAGLKTVGIEDPTPKTTRNRVATKDRLASIEARLSQLEERLDAIEDEIELGKDEDEQSSEKVSEASQRS